MHTAGAGKPEFYRLLFARTADRDNLLSHKRPRFFCQYIQFYILYIDISDKAEYPVAVTRGYYPIDTSGIEFSL